MSRCNGNRKDECISPCQWEVGYGCYRPDRVIVPGNHPNQLRIVTIDVPFSRYDQYERRVKRYNLAGEICAICRDYLVTAMPEKTVCKHIFHEKCIDLLVQRGKFNCPLCRADLFKIPSNPSPPSSPSPSPPPSPSSRRRRRRRRRNRSKSRSRRQQSPSPFYFIQ